METRRYLRIRTVEAPVWRRYPICPLATQARVICRSLLGGGFGEVLVHADRICEARISPDNGGEARGGGLWLLCLSVQWRKFSPWILESGHNIPPFGYVGVVTPPLAFRGKTTPGEISVLAVVASSSSRCDACGRLR